MPPSNDPFADDAPDPFGFAALALDGLQFVSPPPLVTGAWREDGAAALGGVSGGGVDGTNGGSSSDDIFAQFK